MSFDAAEFTEVVSAHPARHIGRGDLPFAPDLTARIHRGSRPADEAQSDTVTSELKHSVSSFLQAAREWRRRVPASPRPERSPMRAQVSWTAAISG